MARTAILLSCCASVLAACAETPDVRMTYYLPKTTLTLTGTRTVACDAKGLYWISGITPTTSTGVNESDVWPIRFKPTQRALVDTDVAVGLTDDGRLKSLNQSAAGHGEEVVKGIMTLVGGVVPLPVRPTIKIQTVHVGPPKPPTPEEIACDVVHRRGKDGFLTLTYANDYEFTGRDTSRIVLAKNSPPWAKPVDDVLPQLCEQLVSVTKPTPQVTFPPTDKNIEDYVHLRQPAHVKVAVVEAKDCAAVANAKQIWAGGVLVPQLGNPYTVPIPKGQPFGKQKLELALADSGAITSLHYGRESGAVAAIGSVNDVVGAFPTETAALNAQSDLIAAQQRNLKCNMDPSNCK